MKINSLLMVFSAVCIFAGTSCSSYKNLPTAQQYESYNKGSDVSTYLSPHSAWFAGELIAVTSDSIYILSPYGVRKLSKTDISRVELNIAQTTNNVRRLTTWAWLLPTSTLLHGFGAIFTLPLNLIISIAVIVDAHQPYKIIYKEDINWDEIAKFSRFPQGLPENIIITQIK